MLHLIVRFVLLPCMASHVSFAAASEVTSKLETRHPFRMERSKRAYTMASVCNLDNEISTILGLAFVSTWTGLSVQVGTRWELMDRQPMLIYPSSSIHSSSQCNTGRSSATTLVAVMAAAMARPGDRAHGTV